MHQFLGGASFVMMMKSADLGNLDHPSVTNVANFAMLGTIHLKRQVRARPVIVVEILADNSPQMPFVQDKDVVQAFSAY